MTDTRTVTQTLLQKIAGGDLDGVGALFAEHVDWVLAWPAGPHPDTPWIRPRASRADAVAHFRELREHHLPDADRSEVHAMLVDGDDAVVLATIGQTARRTGVAYRARCALHLTVRDGLIHRYHVYEDSLGVFQAHAGGSW